MFIDFGEFCTLNQEEEPASSSDSDEAEDEPEASNEHESAMHASQVDFTMRLLRTLQASCESSFIVSPLSISMGLAQLSLCTAGATRDEILQLLAAGSDDDLHDYFGELTQRLPARPSSSAVYDLRIFNHLYISEKLNVREEFEPEMQKRYPHSLPAADFSKREELAKRIDELVRQNTGSKIRGFAAENFPENANMIIVNTLYLNVAWQDKFSRKKTKDGRFYVSPEKTKMVPFMVSTRDATYCELPSAKILHLPYVGRFKLIVVLPRERFGLDAVLETITKDDILVEFKKENYCKYMREVDIELPRFKVENTFRLSEVLPKLGVSKVFLGDANFSALTEQGHVHLDEFVHTAFIDVRFGYGVIALSSLVCRVGSFALNMCSVAALMTYRGLGLNVQHHRGPELRLFFHSLLIFLLQSVTTWHNFMLFNDDYDTVAISLGARPEDVRDENADVRWRPIQGWLSKEAAAASARNVAFYRAYSEAILTYPVRLRAVGACPSEL